MRYLLLLFLLCNTVFALQIKEEVDAIVSNLSGDSEIIIDQGIADGINKGELYRVYLGDLPQSRGVVLSINENFSGIYLFYTLIPVQFKVGDKIKLQRIGPHWGNGHHISKSAVVRLEKSLYSIINNHDKLSFFEPTDSLTLEEKNKLARQGEKNSLINGDFNFSQKKFFQADTDLRKSMRSWKGEVAIAPMTIDSRKLFSSTDISVSAGNSEDAPYNFNLLYRYFSRSETSPVYGTNISHKKHLFIGGIDSPKTFGDLYYTSLIRFDSASYEGVGDPRSRVLISPIGLKAQIFKHKNKRSFIRLLPAVEYTERIKSISPVLYKTEFALRFWAEMDFNFSLSKSSDLSLKGIFIPSIDLYSLSLDPSEYETELTLDYSLKVSNALSISIKEEYVARANSIIFKDKDYIRSSIFVNYDFGILF